MDHGFRIVETLGVEAPFRAVCPCGWLGVSRRAKEDAEASGVAHAELAERLEAGTRMFAKREPVLFDLAADLSRSAGEAALADAAVAQALERGKKEGREALAAALLSELDAAKIDFRALAGGFRKSAPWRETGLTGAEVESARLTWDQFADHLREWLDAGAPERPALDCAWELINARGGSDSARGIGYGAALEDVLGIIEQLGGMDPARRKAVTRG